MNPPQSLDQIIADLNPAYSQSENLIGQQRGGLGVKYGSQRTALNAEKGEGFNAISENANSRGLAFGGIPAHEQAQYLSTKFLPGMQKIAEQQNQEDMQLQMALADLTKEKRLKATDIRGQQQSAYESYLEAERQRAFQAEQSRLTREFEAQQAAATRAAQAASQRAQSATPDTTGAQRAALAVLTAKGAQGKDKKVAPSTFQNAMNAYVGAGGSPNDFRNLYSGYANLQWSPGAYGYY